MTAPIVLLETPYGLVASDEIVNVEPAAAADSLLLETGDHLLLETGDKLLLE